MNDSQFWSRVNELLDERQDPFEDRAVQDCLREATNSERLAELERLTGRLASLDQIERVSTRPPVAKVALIAAGLAGIVTVPFILRGSNDASAPVDEVSQLEITEPSPLRVSGYRLSVSENGPLGQHTTVVEDGRVSRAFVSKGTESRPDRIRLTVDRFSRRLP